MRAIRILSGPPGAGKTTVTRAIAAASDRGVHLHADDFWHYVVSGFVEPWLPESAPQNAVVIEAVASAAARFSAGGYDTFVDGVVGPWFVDVFVDAAREAGAGLDYVVLRPNERVAVTRATRRAEGLADENAVRKMHREFADLGDLERHVVDSSALSPEATVAAVRAGLDEGRFTLV